MGKNRFQRTADLTDCFFLPPMPLIYVEVFEPQISLITLIFSKLQILQITQKILYAQAHEFSQISWRMKKFTPNLLIKFTPNLLSTALAKHDFFEPLIA